MWDSSFAFKGAAILGLRSPFPLDIENFRSSKLISSQEPQQDMTSNEMLTYYIFQFSFSRLFFHSTFFPSKQPYFLSLILGFLSFFRSDVSKGLSKAAKAESSLYTQLPRPGLFRGTRVYFQNYMFTGSIKLALQLFCKIMVLDMCKMCL